MSGKFAGEIDHIVSNPNGYGRAIFDVEMLSRCDEIIITGGSTFGFIATLKAQKMPFYVEGKRLMKECREFNLSAPPTTPQFHAIF